MLFKLSIIRNNLHTITMDFVSVNNDNGSLSYSLQGLQLYPTFYYTFLAFS
jgi:hypothetical protein